MAIKINNDTVIDDSKNVNAGIGTFTELNIAPRAIGFSPADGSTDNEVTTSITITFDQRVYKNSGTIELRSGSASGTIIESIDVSSVNLSSEGSTQVVINPDQNTYNYWNQDIYVVIPSGAFKNSFDNPSEAVNTYNFITKDQTLASFSPTNGATNQTLETNITLTFDETPVQRGTGTITLRRDSDTGTIIESFNAANSNRISISGSSWTLNPTNTLPNNKTIYLVIPDGAIRGFAGLNVAGGTSYSFSVLLQPGDFYGGGYVLSKSAGTAIVVNPRPCSTNICTVDGCTCWGAGWSSYINCTLVTQTGVCGWFVPSIDQLISPGRACRTYWDSYLTNFHWSCTCAPQGPQPFCPSRGWALSIFNGSCCAAPVTTQFVLRAFRCVSY